MTAGVQCDNCRTFAPMPAPGWLHVFRKGDPRHPRRIVRRERGGHLDVLLRPLHGAACYGARPGGGEGCGGGTSVTAFDDLNEVIAILAEALEEQHAERRARFEDYAYLRSCGEPIPSAASRAGVSVRHARERYEVELRAAREERRAA